MHTKTSTSTNITQDSNSSVESTDNEVFSSVSPSPNTVEYGPIKIRLCRKPAPTIATGRRSKHLILIGDEAIKREQRRERNREAARKLKEKRQSIEDELDQKFKELQGEHSELKNCLRQLHKKKQILEEEIDKLSNDPLVDLLSAVNQDMLPLFEDLLDDSDHFDESLEQLLNSNSNVEKQNQEFFVL